MLSVPRKKTWSCRLLGEATVGLEVRVPAGVRAVQGPQPWITE